MRENTSEHRELLHRWSRATALVFIKSFLSNYFSKIFNILIAEIAITQSVMAISAIK